MLHMVLPMQSFSGVIFSTREVHVHFKIANLGNCNQGSYIPPVAYGYFIIIMLVIANGVSWPG